MNCAQARGILNSLLDGDEHRQTHEAREHLEGCSACRAWRSSMERVLSLMQTSEEPAAPDIATVVMAALPERHPASLARPRRGVFMWVTACWLVGVLALALMAIAASQWFSGASAAHSMEYVLDVWRNAEGFLAGPMAAIMAMTQIVGHVFAGLARAAAGFGSSLLWPIALEIAGLLAALIAWRWRRGVAAMFSICAG